jgi:hypothetical protein
MSLDSLRNLTVSQRVPMPRGCCKLMPKVLREIFTLGDSIGLTSTVLRDIIAPLLLAVLSSVWRMERSLTTSLRAHSHYISRPGSCSHASDNLLYFHAQRTTSSTQSLASAKNTHVANKDMVSCPGPSPSASHSSHL